jgi:hypothetical protein
MAIVLRTARLHERQHLVQPPKLAPEAQIS